MTPAYDTTPAHANAVVAAAQWIQQAVLGTAGTIIAIIAVALVGFSLLLGVVSVRRAASVVLGCFVVFAAPTIANALKAFAHTESAAVEIPEALLSEPPRPATPLPMENYDPYAGPTVPLD